MKMVVCFEDSQLFLLSPKLLEYNTLCYDTVRFSIVDAKIALELNN